jgi:hypothetical protein
LTGILIGHSLRDISKVEIFLKKLVNTWILKHLFHWNNTQSKFEFSNKEQHCSVQSPKTLHPGEIRTHDLQKTLLFCSTRF